MFVHDVDRPDKGDTPPKMAAILGVVNETLEGLVPYLLTRCDDNIMSSVEIRGSFDAKENWPSGIEYNSRSFLVLITPEKGKRYYTVGEPVTIEMTKCCHPTLGKFRKSTTTPDKAIERLRKWIVGQKPSG